MPAWMQAVLVAVLTGTIPSVLVYRVADTKRKQDARQATRDDVRVAFDQAKDLYEGGIQEATRRIENCNKRVAALEADVEAARIREQALRRWIRKLEDALHREGIATPNGEPP